MKKIISVILTAVIICSAAALTSCSGESGKDIEIDIDALAKELSEKTTYEDAIVEVDESTASHIIGGYVAGAKKSVFYSSSGATPEMIVVCEYENADGAKTGYENLGKLVEAKKTTFDDYNTQYRPLLDDIVFEQDGRYVILCVSGNADAARSVVANYTK